ncbi:MAG: hypothetical protein ACW968_01290 [Candidatus Thorarchaeota archaeon]|jgi:hypothetical protein
MKGYTATLEETARLLTMTLKPRWKSSSSVFYKDAVKSFVKFWEGTIGLKDLKKQCGVREFPDYLMQFVNYKGTHSKRVNAGRDVG